SRSYFSAFTCRRAFEESTRNPLTCGGCSICFLDKLFAFCGEVLPNGSRRKRLRGLFCDGASCVPCCIGNSILRFGIGTGSASVNSR
ncbi:hypothetical protein, partial [Erwinia amylovora]|uniref:hypothetical protein n=1 Tax=Erwinia amylovora TaxID=552 RepID=UPI0020BDC683